MENKINIAELLKDCPRGMELDCVMFNNVTLWEVEEGAQFPITIKVGIDDMYLLTEYGEWNDGDINAKCVIFPRGKDTWEGFVPPCSEFKEGDVVTYKCEQGLVSMILRNFVNFVEVHFHCALYNNAKGLITDNYIIGEPRYVYHATEEEKEKLFNAIKENGYRWNAETKTLEKLIEPKFKVGDRIKTKTSSYHYFVAEIRDNCYLAIYNHEEYPYLIPFVNEKYYELVTDKFDISTLKPYDKVLGRSTTDGIWRCDFLFNIKENGIYKYECIAYCYKYCIPFEGNEHLRGTTDDCSEYYKIWEA